MGTMPCMRQIHFFKAGQHTSAAGQQITFTAADLQAMATAYDPAVHEAPLVVGHPTNDGPAYGWVQSLRLEGGDLLAIPHQVNPQFAELVESKAYKKVSASWYSPTHPSNPKPGTYYLRHIGFLGAQPPAIKGLRGPEFADTDADATQLVVVEVEFSEGAVGAPATHPQDPDAPPKGAPSMTEAEIAALKADRDAAVAARDAAQAQLNAAAAAANTAAHTAFAEGLVTAAKVPREKLPLVVALLDFAEPPATAGAQVVEFGEGDAKAPLAKHLKDFLTSLPAQVAFAEQASKDKAATGKPGDTERRARLLEKARLEFGEGVDQARLEKHVDVTLYAEDHKLTYAEALRAMPAKA